MLIAVLIIGLLFGFLSGAALGYALALADRPVRDPRAVPDPRAAPLTVDVALVGDTGGSVTRLTIPATARRPKMTWPSPGGGLAGVSGQPQRRHRDVDLSADRRGAPVR
jgi:hypothetical protein